MPTTTLKSLALKALSALALPALAWGVSLEVRLAVLIDDQAETSGLQGKIDKNAHSLTALGVKFDNLNEKADEIKELLRDL